MSTVFAATFWKAAAERAVKTFCQAFAAAITIGAVGDAANVFTADWRATFGYALGVAATATLYSVLSSVASAPFGPEGTPSVVSEAPVYRPPLR